LSNKDTILVTGGAGYVGSTIVNDLAEKGHNVKAFDSLVFFKEKTYDIFKNDSIEFIYGDIRDCDLLGSSLKDVDCVIHLAAITGPLCDRVPLVTQQINDMASSQFIEICKMKKVKRFFFASTCSNYGSNLKIVNENTPLMALSLYSKTKVKTESLVLETNNKNFETCVLRLATVFGISPIMRFDLLLQELIMEAFLNKKIKIFGPSYWRPLIHVKDVSKAFLSAVYSPSELISGEVFNVGSTKQNFTKLELAKMIQRYMSDIEIEVQEFKKDPRNYQVSFDKITNYLGFRTEHTIHDGISEMIHGLNDKTIDLTTTDFSFRSSMVDKVLVF